MLKFPPYPITINGSYLGEALRNQIEAARNAGRFEEARRLVREMDARAYQEDKSANSQWYEKRVSALLAYIRHTTAGRTLLDKLPGKSPVWILPMDSQTVHNSKFRNWGFADTNRRSGGADGVRIKFSPESWTYQAYGQLPSSRPDEVLFHELVHAYRFGTPGGPTLNAAANPEEFLAMQLTNIYVSERHGHVFMINYDTSQLGDQGAAENEIQSFKPFWETLVAFAKDPLGKAFAQINTVYNPLRDAGRLKP